MRCPATTATGVNTIPIQRRLAGLAAAAAAGTVLYWKDDLTQLQFELASATGPLLRLLDAETSHNIGIWAMRHGLTPQETRSDPPSLATTVWGRHFTNPIGRPNDSVCCFLHMLCNRSGGWLRQTCRSHHVTAAYGLWIRRNRVCHPLASARQPQTPCLSTSRTGVRDTEKVLIHCVYRCLGRYDYFGNLGARTYTCCVSGL